MSATQRYALIVSGCLTHAAMISLVFLQVPPWLSLILLSAWPNWIFALWRYRWLKMFYPMMGGLVILYPLYHWLSGGSG